MTDQELQAMIYAGDKQKCHVEYEGKHYFKFGSYWMVEDGGPVVVRVFDNSITRELDRLKEALLIIKVAEAPEITTMYQCAGRPPYGCGWKGQEHEIKYLNKEQQRGICPNCGQWVQPMDEDDW